MSCAYPVRAGRDTVVECFGIAGEGSVKSYGTYGMIELQEETLQDETRLGRQDV